MVAISLATLLVLSCATHTPAPLSITLANDSAAEQAAHRQLQRLLDRYDLSPWFFTARVLIDENTRIPHSHPVLTLTARTTNDNAALATFIHEQLHWYLEAKDPQVQQAVAVLKQRYPEAPVRGSQGARSTFSTYLHLLNCWLELDAMARLVGEQAARETLADWNHYRWIYDRVLNETDAIGDVVRRFGLDPLAP